MKNSVSIIVAVTTGAAVYLAISYFELSFLWILLTLIPVSYIQIYLTNRHNFRDSVQMELVPPTSNEKRIAWLNANQAELANFGFTKFDEFYMRLSPDVLVYAYRHEQYPITLVDYNMQIMTFCDLVTQFDNGCLLTTSNGGNAGLTPLPENALLQVFPDRGFPELVRAHIDALEFLKPKGFHSSRLQSENYRQAFL